MLMSPIRFRSLQNANHRVRRPRSGEGAEYIPGHLRGKCDKADDRHKVIFKAYRGKSLADYPCSHRAEGCFIKAL